LSLIFSAIVVSSLMLLGFAFGGVRLPLANLAKLLGTLVAGSLPFSALVWPLAILPDQTPRHRSLT